jgi:hypothetical protein
MRAYREGRSVEAPALLPLGLLFFQDQERVGLAAALVVTSRVARITLVLSVLPISILRAVASSGVTVLLLFVELRGLRLRVTLLATIVARIILRGKRWSRATNRQGQSHQGGHNQQGNTPFHALPVLSLRDVTFLTTSWLQVDLFVPSFLLLFLARAEYLKIMENGRTNEAI